MLRALTALIAALAVLLGAGAAMAEKRALLIGVANYDNPSIRSLSGPRNDVILLWRYLTANGFAAANIHVLAEGLPEGASTPRANAPPTRAQIMRGFNDLADRAQAGDFVVIHFSGHGTTQPETSRPGSGPEAGDRDQVLLPKDAGDYDNIARTIRNGIVDDEIGEALDKIRAKGAVVWAIVDACHAGTVTRSGAVATRGAQPESLGVPTTSAAPNLRSTASAAPQQRAGLIKDMGAKASLIGFFAVDSWTEAIEREFDFKGEFAPGPNGGPPRFGVFTYHLVRALNNGRARTFRDLARIVALDIASSGSIAQAPLPYFDGDLDLTLSGAETQFARRFPATAVNGKLAIEAGGLHGFDPQASVAIFDGPLDDAKRIGLANVQSADAASSVAAITGDVPQEAGNLWASVEAPGLTLRYRVGLIANEASEQAKTRELMRAALTGSDPNSAIAIDVVDSGERDMDVRVSQGRIWLTAEGRPFVTDPTSHERSVSIALEGRPSDEVTANLRRALFGFARAANLVRVAAAADLGGARNDDVQIVLERVRESDPYRLSNPRRDCGDLARPTPPEPIAVGDTAPLGHCDQVRTLVTNRGDRDMFVGIFLLTPTGAVGLPHASWRQNGCVDLAPARATTPIALRTTVRTWSANGPNHTGIHRVLVFAIPRTQSTALNLCHLLQPDTESARKEVVALRSAGARKGFLGLLDRVAAAEPSLRGGANPFEDSPEETSSVIVRQFTLDVRPPLEK